MAIAFVKKSTPAAVATGTTIAGTIASVTGNTLVAVIQHQSAGVVSVTDSAGNTWVKGADTQDQAATSQRRVAIWYALNATAVTSVTATLDTSGASRIFVYEYSGVGSLRGAAAGAQTTATSPAPVTVTGVLSGDLVLGAIGYNEAVAGTRLDTLVSGQGYTELDSFDNGAAPRMSSAASIRTTDGATGPAWTMSSGTTAAATIALTPSAPTASVVALVKKSTPAAVAAGTTITGSIAGVAGNTLIAVIQHQSAAVVSVTDSAGGTWLKAADTLDQAATSQRRVAIWYRLNAPAVTTVTATLDVSGASRLLVYEYSGIGAYRGGKANAMSTATSPPSAAVTAVLTGDLVLGALGYNQTVAGTRQDTLNSGEGYTELDSFDNAAAPRISTAASVRSVDGATGPTWTMTSGTTGSVSAAFAPAATGSTPPSLQADADLSVEPWITTNTSCIANDVDGVLPAANYVCTQTAGPTVTLTGTGNSRTFAAPAVVGGTTLAFAWNVTDAAGTVSNTDTQTITVLPPKNFHLRTGTWQPMRVVSLAP